MVCKALAVVVYKITPCRRIRVQFVLHLRLNLEIILKNFKRTEVRLILPLKCSQLKIPWKFPEIHTKMFGRMESALRSDEGEAEEDKNSLDDLSSTALKTSSG